MVYALISPELALLLTRQRGWDLSTYGAWLGDQVAEQIDRLAESTREDPRPLVRDVGAGRSSISADAATTINDQGARWESVPLS